MVGWGINNDLMQTLAPSFHQYVYLLILYRLLIKHVILSKISSACKLGQIHTHSDTGTVLEGRA